MDKVTLPPELEQFAAEAIAADRYRDHAEIIATALNLLQRQEQARTALLESVIAAEAEAARDGYLTAEDMIARVEMRLARRHGAPA